MTDSHNYPSSATIHRETLPNGITVLVYERPGSQSVMIEGYLPAGALAETAEQSGFRSGPLHPGAASVCQLQDLPSPPKNTGVHPCVSTNRFRSNPLQLKHLVCFSRLRGQEV